MRLRRARVGQRDDDIAMGAGGTDVALETADVALMADDLSKLPFALASSRRGPKHHPPEPVDFAGRHRHSGALHALCFARLGIALKITKAQRSSWPSTRCAC